MNHAKGGNRRFLQVVVKGIGFFWHDPFLQPCKRVDESELSCYMIELSFTHWKHHHNQFSQHGINAVCVCFARYVDMSKYTKNISIVPQ